MIVLEHWLLTPYRLAVHLPTRTAVLADLHLGYHWTRQRAGDAVPLPGLDEQLAPLAAARKQHSFREVVLAGDVIEKAWDGNWLAEWRRWLDEHDVRIRAVVPGNHDRQLPEALGPICREPFQLDGWRIVHGDGLVPAGPVVMGHWHPCVRRRGRKLPCYLVGAESLVLPAFSAEAAGADVAREERWRGWQAWAISGGRVVEAGKPLRS